MTLPHPPLPLVRPPAAPDGDRFAAMAPEVQSEESFDVEGGSVSASTLPEDLIGAFSAPSFVAQTVPDDPDLLEWRVDRPYKAVSAAGPPSLTGAAVVPSDVSGGRQTRRHIGFSEVVEKLLGKEEALRGDRGSAAPPSDDFGTQSLGGSASLEWEAVAVPGDPLAFVGSTPVASMGPGSTGTSFDGLRFSDMPSSDLEEWVRGEGKEGERPRGERNRAEKPIAKVRCLLRPFNAARKPLPCTLNSPFPHPALVCTSPPCTLVWLPIGWTKTDT